MNDKKSDTSDIPEISTVPEASESSAPSPVRKKLTVGQWLLYFSVGGLLSLVLMGFGLLGPTGRTADIQIPKGAGASAVGRILEKSGLVRSGALFSAYLRISGKDKGLKPGFYTVEGNGLKNVAIYLTEEAQPKSAKVTIPEGWRADQIAERLTENQLDGAGFFELVKNPPEALRPVGMKSKTLEGFLFPATYDLPLDFSAEDIIKAMTQRFELEVTPAVEAKLKTIKLSVQDWVTLASVVQAEAANDGERPAIAGVFLNRLEIGQGLQSDPTVAYGLGKKLPELNRNEGDFNSESPYNTYKFAGLPPGAIGNPGINALQSILASKRTNAAGKKVFFFLHAGGNLYLNTDFASHLRDTARYYR